MGFFKRKVMNDKVITKTSKQAMIDRNTQEQLEKEKGTCPECGYYDLWNGGIESYEPLKGRREYFECEKCGCQWEYLSR